MSHFRLRWMLKGRPSRNRPEQNLERRVLRLGSSPGDDVLLPDQLVAARALVFRTTPSGGALIVEPHDLYAGAFKNGIPITESTRFEPGDQLSIGQALVKLSIEEDPDEVYVLEIHEDHLGHTIFEQTKRELSIDLEGWGEAGWGRSRILRRANLAALVLGLAALAVFPLGTQSELLSRGPISSVHAAQGVRCRDCHTPYKATSDAACLECHQGFEGQATHPYGQAVACASCHIEHRGEVPLSPEVGFDAEFASKRASVGICAACHQGALPRAPEKRRSVKDRAFETVALLEFEAFSHADHLVRRHKDGKQIACSVCHFEPDATKQSDEFRPVGYRQCLDCHATWRVENHGRGPSCLACHADEQTGTLKETVLSGGTGLYHFVPRGHDVGQTNCATCHLSGKTQVVERPARAFRHDRHLSHSPITGKLDLVKAKAECRICHPGIENSATLDQLEVTTDGVCSQCHGEASKPVRIPAPDAMPRRARDMTHQAHFIRRGRTPPPTLAEGCLSCHLPASGAERMALREGVADCTGCHSGHENLERNKCANCHREAGQAEGGRRLEMSVFHRERALRTRRFRTAKFFHRSPGHRRVDCTTCHQAMEQARRLKEIVIPRADDASCRRCHEVARFHR